MNKWLAFATLMICAPGVASAQNEMPAYGGPPARYEIFAVETKVFGLPVMHSIRFFILNNVLHQASECIGEYDPRAATIKRIECGYNPLFTSEVKATTLTSSFIPRNGTKLISPINNLLQIDPQSGDAQWCVLARDSDCMAIEYPH